MEYAGRVTSRSLDSLWRTANIPKSRAWLLHRGTGSSDNTFASLSDNGPHIISMNIRLSPSDKRDRWNPGNRGIDA